MFHFTLMTRNMFQTGCSECHRNISIRRGCIYQRRDSEENAFINTARRLLLSREKCEGECISPCIDSRCSECHRNISMRGSCIYPGRNAKENAFLLALILVVESVIEIYQCMAPAFIQGEMQGIMQRRMHLSIRGGCIYPRRNSGENAFINTRRNAEENAFIKEKCRGECIYQYVIPRRIHF